MLQLLLKLNLLAWIKEIKLCYGLDIVLKKYWAVFKKIEVLEKNLGLSSLDIKSDHVLAWLDENNGFF